MSETKCCICNKELTGGLDTFGRVGEERCAPCWWETGDLSGWMLREFIEEITSEQTPKVMKYILVVEPEDEGDE